MADNTAKQHAAKQPRKKTVPRPKRKPRLFTAGEKAMFLLFIAAVCFLCAQLISTQAAIYETNKDLQDMNRQIQEQTKVNNDLDMQISEESTYEKIWERVKAMGLDLSQNIKVVEKDE